MSKLKIFLYHLLVFVLGSVGIGTYVFYHLTLPANGAEIAGVIIMPVIILTYVVAFGILCALSLAVFLLVSYFRRRKNAKINLK